VVLGLVAPLCLVPACGSSGADLGSLTGKSPEQILGLASTAIASKKSFHFVDQSRVGKNTTTLTGNDSSAGADQTLSGVGAALEVVRIVGGAVFLRGAAGALVSALGLPQAIATANAGRWISLFSSDGPYAAVTASLDPQGELATYVPQGQLRLEGPRAFRGTTVVGVTGTAPASAVNGTGRAVTLYIPTEAPYTPVGATLTLGTGKSQGAEAVVFDHWGERINPAVPTGAVAYSSLPH
jgi:hypothetical protein